LGVVLQGRWRHPNVSRRLLCKQGGMSGAPTLLESSVWSAPVERAATATPSGRWLHRRTFTLTAGTKPRSVRGGTTFVHTTVIRSASLDGGVLHLPPAPPPAPPQGGRQVPACTPLHLAPEALGAGALASAFAVDAVGAAPADLPIDAPLLQLSVSSPLDTQLPPTIPLLRASQHCVHMAEHEETVAQETFSMTLGVVAKAALARHLHQHTTNLVGSRCALPVSTAAWISLTCPPPPPTAGAQQWTRGHRVRGHPEVPGSGRLWCGVGRTRALPRALALWQQVRRRAEWTVDRPPP
jgi:hypothetical protein